MTAEVDPATAWSEVHAQADALRETHLRDLFARDPERFAGLSFRLDDLLIDFSKEKLDAAALTALIGLARAARLEETRDAMFAGAPVNATERRAALHMALRGGAGEQVMVDGEDVMPAVDETLARFLAFAEDVRAGRHAALSGEPFTDALHIGIGGSVLGPEMATRALAPWHDGPRLHYLANVDGADLTDTIRGLDPARTLVIVASKSFTTLETMTNAGSALARGGAGRGGRAPPGRGLDQPRGDARLRHRRRAGLRLLGLGRRALLDLVRDRPAHRHRHRCRELPRLPGRGPRHRRAFPRRPARAQPAGAHGPGLGLAAQRHGLAHRGAGALRGAARALARLRPAARHGVERQAGDRARRSSGPPAR